MHFTVRYVEERHLDAIYPYIMRKKKSKQEDESQGYLSEWSTGHKRNNVYIDHSATIWDPHNVG
jgi:hypothetical protein